MKRIKRTTKILATLLVVSLVLVACGRKDEEASKRLTQINAEVESLYNEEMNDLKQDLLLEDFDEVQERIEAEDREELNEENTRTLEKIENLYQNAMVMYELDGEVEELFTEDVLDENIKMEEVEDLLSRLSEIDKQQWTDYVSRQKDKLSEAQMQLVKIYDAEDLLNKLSLEDDRISSEATREDEQEAIEAVSQIKNETIREVYETRLDHVDEVLTEREIELKKATEGVGNFEGMYLSTDNIILYIDNKKTIFAENTVSGGVPYYEIQKVIDNTGKELTLEVYEKPDPAFEIEGGQSQQTYYLSDDHQTVTYSDGRKFHRLSQPEQDEILYELSGLKSMIENNSPWNY